MAQVQDIEFSWLNSNHYGSDRQANTLYQRKYPIRLPSLPDWKHKWDQFTEDSREEMPMLEKQHLFNKRDVPEKLEKKLLDGEIELLDIEDFGDKELEAELHKYQLSISSSKNKVKQERKLSLSPKDNLQHHLTIKRSFSLPQQTTRTSKKKKEKAIITVSPSKTLKDKHKNQLSSNKLQKKPKHEQTFNDQKFKDTKPSLKNNRRTNTPDIVSLLKTNEQTKTIKHMAEKMKSYNSKSTTTNKKLFEKPTSTGNSKNSSGKSSIKEVVKSAQTNAKSRKAFRDSIQVKRSTKEKQTEAEEVKIVESLNEETSKEEIGLSEKLCEGDKFWNEAFNDAQMKLIEDKTTQIIVVRDELDRIKGEPISFVVAKALRIILFGSSLRSFNGAWRDQTLVFNQPKHYGLKFFKDGPVDIMVPLQGFIMKYLLFVNVSNNTAIDITDRLKPDKDAQQRALYLSICDILWRAGEKKHAVIALPLGECTFIPDNTYREDKITEKYQLLKFTVYEDIEKFLRRNVRLFQENGSNGLISFLYSLMLSRGLKSLQEDCEELNHGLLESSQGNSISKSQALINLCIYGKAVPNIFNGNTEVKDAETGKITILNGVKKRCEIGYLTHEEFLYPTTYMVGSCLKTPMFPIWVLSNFGRISIIFSLKRDLLNDWKLERRFDLYLYQGIPRYVVSVQLDIKLTIDTIQPLVDCESDEEDNSTVEETIRTKWSEAVIEWNGHTRF